MKKWKRLVAAVLFVSVLLVSVQEAHAAALVTSFSIKEDVDTSYAIDDVPEKFVVTEITSDSLGNQHELKWVNPKGIGDGYRVEIYAAVEFQMYAPAEAIDSFLNGMRVITWDEMENAASSSWVAIDSPFAYVGDYDATDKSCTVDFDKLLKCIEDYAVSDSTSSEGFTVFKNLTTLAIDYASKYLTKGSVTLTEDLNLYSYVINNEVHCRYFKFSKMKYFIRYVKTEEKTALGEDGQYHYYVDYELLGGKDVVPGGRSMCGFLEQGERFGIHDIRVTDVSSTYVENKGIFNNADYYMNHVRYEFISPHPIAFVCGFCRETNWKDAAGLYMNPPVVYPDTWDRIVDFMACIPLDIWGVDLGTSLPVRHDIDFYRFTNFELPYTWHYDAHNPEYLLPSVPDRRLTQDETLQVLLMYGNGHYDTNIPFFSSTFLESAKLYLTDGELHGGSYVFDYNLKGPLMQNTIGFKAGGGLDGSTASSGVIDGDNDTDNGWLKKIYLRLGVMLEKMGNSTGADMSGIMDKLDKLNKRLKKTNQWLAAIFVENTIADVLDNINKAVIGDAAKSADSLVDTAVTKFPFSIVYDIKYMGHMMEAEPKTFYKEIDFRIPSLAGKTEPWKIVIDFSVMDGFISKIRAMVYIIFCVGLVPLTMRVANFIKRQVDN